MDKLNLILLIGMVILCTVVFMVYIDTVYGAHGGNDIITILLPSNIEVVTVL